MSKNLHSMINTVELTPIAVRINDATRLTGIGKTKLFELIAAGKLETASVGRRRLILYSSLQSFLHENRSDRPA
jgi:excisionase family DNA binding protein